MFNTIGELKKDKFTNQLLETVRSALTTYRMHLGALHELHERELENMVSGPATEEWEEVVYALAYKHDQATDFLLSLMEEPKDESI